MALLTKAGMSKILRRIMESGELTENMETDVNRLRDDFDEREGMLRRYGEVYDGEDRDEYEWRERDRNEEADSDEEEIFTPREEEKLEGEDWKGRYDDLKRQYLDRFFGGTEAEVEEIMDETREDVKRDGEPQTFDELLFRAEG